MQIQADTEVSLFVRDRVTGRLVFNSKAIEALGLKPTELAQRGYNLRVVLAWLRVFLRLILTALLRSFAIPPPLRSAC
jgi:hypothetical protein